MRRRCAGSGVLCVRGLWGECKLRLAGQSRRSMPPELPAADRLLEEDGVGGKAHENPTGWSEVAGEAMA